MDDFTQKVVVAGVSAGISIIGTIVLKELVYDRWKASRARKPRFQVMTQRHTDSRGIHSLEVSVYYVAGPDLYDAEPTFEFKLLPDEAISTEVRWLALGRTLEAQYAGRPHGATHMPSQVRQAWTGNKGYDPNTPWKAGQTKKFALAFDALWPWEYLDASDSECGVLTMGNKHATWLRHNIDDDVRMLYTQLIEERRKLDLLHFDPHGPEPTIGEAEKAQVAEVKAALDRMLGRPPRAGPGLPVG